MKLVLGGSANKNSQELMDTIAASSWKNEIILPGRIEPVSRLREIIGSAYAMTYVSSFEGFGIPVIEAQKCGVPVLSADNSSLPEVAGEAALFVDHSSPESIADGMQKLWKDPALCETLREKGRTNASRFSCDRTAQLMWDCIEKTLAVC